MGQTKEQEKMQNKMTPGQMRVTRRNLDFKVETRELNVDANGQENQENQEMWVQGRAVTFNSPTVLFEYDGIEYKEQIDRNAFAECKMDDVIFNYNHEGKVLARTRNRTLNVEVRDDGLYIMARLDGTEQGRQLYQEIKGGYIDRMSFQFSIREESFDKVNHMWTVHKCKRLYDVAAVSIPAYDDTSIEARKNFILESDDQEKRKREAAADFSKRKLKLKIKLSNM